jgi:ATP-dependent DNA helicase RecG
MEHQNIEWKSSWRDEYLEWVCGFANAQGGVLEIGRDDNGVLVGLSDSRKLLEMLPNKIRTTMGIIADVNLMTEGGKEYISIKVAAHHNAISYRGRYYYRSGSTNQELTGYSLDELLLGKYGKTWDAVPVPHLNTEDFYRDAFSVCRKKAVTSGRLAEKDVEGSDEDLLQFLKLTENKYIVKAAALLFHENPEKWCLGSYVKIGYFEKESELTYQDEVNGPILMIPDKVMDIIFLKYFKGLIRYEGIQRIDEYPMPREALREAILNAVVHKAYETSNPIQIKIFDDKVYVFNDARLPYGITEQDLQNAHKSTPYNPLIANTFFRSGQIEAWGRGIKKIIDACVDDGLPVPEFRITPTEFMVCFHIRNNNKAIAERKIYSANGSGINSGIKNGINETRQKIIDLMQNNPKISAREIAEQLGFEVKNIESHIRALRKAGHIEREGARKTGRWIVIKK